MKTVLKVFLLVMMFSMAFISCKNDVDNPLSSNYNSIKSDGVLSGKIVNIVSDEVDAIKVILYDHDSNVNATGVCNVESDGSFTVTLSKPSSLEKIGNALLDDFIGTISDESAQVSIDMEIVLFAYKNNTEIGYVRKCNFLNESSEDNEGSVISYFVYSDRLLKIAGKKEEQCI